MFETTPPLFYLCYIFKKSLAEIKEALQIHPHPNAHSFPVIQRNIEFLLSQGFSHDDIFQDLPIILYSMYVVTILQTSLTHNTRHKNYAPID